MCTYLFVYACMRKEKGVEQFGPVHGGNGRKEVGKKIRGEIINFSSCILIMFTLVTMVVKCHTFLLIE